MKGILIFIVLFALAFSTVKWYTVEILPEKRRQEMSNAAKKYYEEKRQLPKEIRDLQPYLDGEVKPLVEAEWYIDQTDKNDPVKIYKWKYYKCPNDNFEITVLSPVRPISLICEKCKKNFYVTEGELYSKNKDDDKNFYYNFLNKLFNKKKEEKK
ncbi:hypothetical protein KA977_08575 [Candidatus Dependentiae bacterium]|nr:hypothetical protein [Candidatus Dependentiae bacterium]